MAESQGSLEFSVSELTLSILEGFLAAASLHLGQAGPDGRLLEAPSPMEAWLALKSAGALMDQLAPVMSEDARLPLHARLTFLFEELERRVPQPSATKTRKPVGSLRGIVEEAWKSLDDTTPPAAAPRPAGPSAPSTSLPGTGLPRRGSGLLFPPRGK